MYVCLGVFFFPTPRLSWERVFAAHLSHLASRLPTPRGHPRVPLSLKCIAIIFKDNRIFQRRPYCLNSY
jgi:hypothetical protein